jgi:FtsZ-interacting cell division protein ZipA
MTSLQLVLFAAGGVLVAGVLVYNWMQERRIRRQIDAAFRQSERRGDAQHGDDGSTQDRIEPTLPGAVPENAPRARVMAAEDDGDYEPPLAIQNRIASDISEDDYAVATAPLSEAARPPTGERNAPQPDPDIECIVALQPAKPVAAGALAAGLHARLGRPLRWFGRRGPGLPWQQLKSDTGGEFSEIIACLLLADRAGAASRPLLDSYIRMVADIASGLPSPYMAPDAAAEAARAEALDRICADLDVQIGLTLLKSEGTIAGTRLRGVAEASGFRLADGGRFDWIQEETGAALYSLQNYRSEPFTAETLRAMATPGAVFVLDVPRVPEPVRVYDQMKLVAKRIAHSLDAILVDDNRRPLDDAALSAIRDQVRATAVALTEVRIEAGSARALALFGG